MAYVAGSLLILQNYEQEYNIIDPNYKRYESYSLTLGDNAYYLAVWADPSAGLNNGKLHVATTDGLFIIDLTKKALYDRYTQTIKGRANETLISNDIEDITIGG